MSVFHVVKNHLFFYVPTLQVTQAKDRFFYRNSVGEDLEAVLLCRLEFRIRLSRLFKGLLEKALVPLIDMS